MLRWNPKPTRRVSPTWDRLEVRAEECPGLSFEQVMASNQDHQALDPLIANQHKHQPRLVSLLDLPTSLNEPWKPTSRFGMDEVQKAVGSSDSGAELSLPGSCQNSRSYGYFRGRVLSTIACRFVFARTRLELGSLVRGLCLISDMASSPLLTRQRSAAPRSVGKASENVSQLEKDSLPFLVWNTIGAGTLPEVEGGKESAARWYGAFKQFEEMAFLFMARSLMSIRGYYDAVQVLEDALKRFPSRQ